MNYMGESLQSEALRAMSSFIRTNGDERPPGWATLKTNQVLKTMAPAPEMLQSFTSHFRETAE